ncbi:MAG: phosphotransferase [Pseudomonadales bacterium]|nr:phosphotransferase [Pseudomonadales bacterium]
MRAVPGCENGEPPLSVTPLAGGISNTTAQVRTTRGHFAVRVNATGVEGLAIDRQREVALHRVAAAAGLAPAVIVADPTGRFLITEFVDGRAWTAACFSRAADLRELAGRLRVLHSVTPPQVAPFDPATVLQDYVRIVRPDSQDDRALLKELLDRGQRALDGSKPSTRTATIVHNDLDARNLIQNQRLVLIDWEYAQVGDPLMDLACVLSYYPQAAEHSRLLLSASGLQEHGATFDMLSALADWHRLISYLWCRARCRRDQLPANQVDLERRIVGGAALR